MPQSVRQCGRQTLRLEAPASGSVLALAVSYAPNALSSAAAWPPRSRPISTRVSLLRGASWTTLSKRPPSVTLHRQPCLCLSRHSLIVTARRACGDWGSVQTVQIETESRDETHQVSDGWSRHPGLRGVSNSPMRRVC